MGLLRHLKNLGGFFVLVIEDRIESWSTDESRPELQKRLREAADRGGELALKVACLEDELDGLRFNGPSLWSDEVNALKLAAAAPGSSGYSPAIKQLLNRCDHMPMTAHELDEQVRGITDGTVKTIPWNESFFRDDPGIDIDVHGLSCLCPQCRFGQ